MSRAIVLCLLLAACGSSETRYAPATLESFGLTRSIALIDRNEHEVILLEAAPEQRLASKTIAVGKNISRALMSADARFLFVLSAGDSPRRKASDERPSLTVIDGETLAIVLRYELPILRDKLVLDPRGRYVALFAGDSTSAVVDNPNEIVLLDLAAEPSDANPLVHTLRSFGGRPQRFTFTDPLELPGGTRRLLVAETEKDVAILDLERMAGSKGEITVRLDLPSANASLAPNGLIADDGEAGRDDDARLAVRIKGDSAVLVLDLVANAAGDLTARTNLVDVGGEPSEISFVTTDGGRRMVALVPAMKHAALVTLATTAVQTMPLPAAYDRLAFVEEASQPTPRSALLWGQGVALWSLDLATGRPFASVESLALPGKIKEVRDLPGAPNQKLLIGDQNSFFVLDLRDRTVAPLLTQSNALQYYLPRDVRRLWAFQPAQARAARVNLDTLQAKSLVFDRNVHAMYELTYIDGDREGRALIALHGEGTVGATVLDPAIADEADARVYFGLMIGGVK
ncbi:MAG: hypothetical protein IT381_07745 [Deltaproteobacteria bacterium]|nr:hypothetical protein [Deltaproteobacteria bacterium]